MKEPVQLCYTISEAAKVMEVEPHVLRYWEEELGLDISRNSMGHRIYTDDDLKTFRAIKQLKANHVALKEIRQQIVVSGEKTPLKKDCEKEFCGDKMTQFKSILSNIIKDAINENTGELSSQISSQVSDDMRKEMDYLARMPGRRAGSTVLKNWMKPFVHYKKQGRRQPSLRWKKKNRKRKSVSLNAEGRAGNLNSNR